MSKNPKGFDPDTFLQSWSPQDLVPSESNGRTFRQCIAKAFGLAENDDYIYRAQGVTTLEITERAISGQRAHGLHDWYHDEEGKSEPSHPSSEEVDAYINLFGPSVALPKALNSFKASSKAKTLQHLISHHLNARFLNKTQGLLSSKKDRQHVNPYLDLWQYSCRELEWAGPWPNTVHTKMSHHILPIFYHHFGCIVPSHVALYVLARLSQPSKPSKEPIRPILDIGSGNGYWTFMLRQFHVKKELGQEWKELEVYAVDNQLSEFRISWISDTVISDGIKFLKEGKLNISGEQRGVDGGKGCVLLLVYPQATGNFTASILKAFQGDAIVVAGTQNGNGFTAFQSMLVDKWVEKNRQDFELTLRMPLPSFAGKDEALFVFQRKKA